MAGDAITVLRGAALFGALVVWIAGCGGDVDTGARLACSFAVSPSSGSYAASGGTGSVTITTPAGCSWTPTSDADFVTVTTGSSGQGSGTVTYNVAPNTTASAREASIKVAHLDGQSVASHQISQQGSTGALPRLSVRGAYTFRIEADLDGTCGLPVTTFYWPVTVQVTSYGQGSTLGSIWFPPTRSDPSNKWSISVSPARTQLTPGPRTPGPAAAAYNVVVDGGRWEAGGPTRALDGRGQITRGAARGARLILALPGSDKRWECRSDAKWSLLTRYVDQD